MAAPVIEVKGVRELRRSMRKAGEDLTQMNRANQAVSNFVTARATASAPRGETGRLAGSVRGSAGRTMAIVRAGGARVRYAQPIHWGWPRRNIRAQPWISDAATSTEEAWLGLYSQAIEQILNKVKGA